MSDGLAINVPPRIADAVRAYLDRRAQPNQFVRALLANHLWDAAAYCPPEVSLIDLRASVRLIFNAVPGRARGSYNAVDAWVHGSTQAEKT